MMKVTLLVLVIVAAIFSSVFAADFALHLESGTPVTGLATSADDSQCTYVHLAVAEGTVAVQIDVSTSETNYVDVTAGFNYAPSALESTSNGYLFGDNNVYLSNNKRYFLCTYNPMAVFGSYNPMPSVYTSSTGYCAAYVPDLHAGGDVFVCLSTYSTASTNVSVTVTALNVTATGAFANAMTMAVPAAAGTTSADQSVFVYKLWMPMNVTDLSVTTTSSSTVIRTPGLWYNAYTTGNSLSMGYFAQGTWFFLVVIQSSSTAESFTLSVSENCDGMMTYPVSNSEVACYTPQNITTLAPALANFTAIGDNYALYRLWLPATPSASVLYTVNVTVNTTNFSGYVYFSGWSYYGADSSVNPSGVFTVSRNYQSVYSVYTSAAAHFILPATYINIVVESSSLSYDTSVSVAVYAEPLPVFVYGAANLTADNLEVTVASIAGLTVGNYFTTAMLNAEEGKAYNLTVTSTNTLVGVIVASEMGVVVSTANIGYSSASSFTLYLPFLQSGTYMISAIPYGSGSVSNTYSVVITDSPSNGGSTSAASTASYSFLFMIVALLATLLF